MTWASLIANGYGRIVGYRLMIEGWTDVWVTHPAITWNSTDLDGRTIRNGLLTDGIQFGERLNARECMTEATGFTAKIRSATSSDEAVASLSRDVSPVDWLGASIDASATTMSLQSGGSLSNSSYYHIGTEVVKVGTWTAITRKKWNTQAQSHNIEGTGPSGDEVTPVPIYQYPPTMEGRRCVLYAYGEGDDVTGAGTAIFRGIVTRPPRLGSDGLTWEIHIAPRHQLLAQNLTSSANQAKLVGIYHHKSSPFYVWMRYNSTSSEFFYVTGLYDTMEEFIKEVNVQFAACLSSITATNIRWVFLEHDPLDGSLRINMRTAGTAPNFIVAAGSPIVGYTADTDWVVRDSGESIAFDDIGTNTTYLKSLTGAFGAAAIQEVPVTALGDPPIDKPASPYLVGRDFDPDATESPWSVHVDRNLGLQDGDFIHITGTDQPGGIFEVEDTTAVVVSSGTVQQITVKPVTLPGNVPFVGYLSGDVTVTKLLDYGEGDVADFLAQVVVNAALYANDGDAAFLCDDTTGVGDIGTWTVLAAPTFHPALTNRIYRFGKAKSLREILSEELKLIGHYLRLDATGRMVIAPLPFFSQVMTADTTIDRSVILTPAGGVGTWPGWEPQRDGLVNHVEVQDEYDPVEDEWTGQTFVYRDVASIAEHKTRGKGKITVKPYSAAYHTMDAAAATQVATGLLSFMARDYATVTVKVPFSCFSLLVGDVVKLTHALIPNGNGTRGVTAKRAVVIERKWSLDMAAGDPGELVLYIQRGDDGGYTPGGLITSQSGATTTWTLTLDSANGVNLAVSQDGDGVVAEHFSVGDYIHIVMYGDPAETTYTGTVTSQSGNTVGVSLDASWTPGSDTWLLGWPKDTGSNASTHQQGFTYIADTGLMLTTSQPARRLR